MFGTKLYTVSQDYLLSKAHPIFMAATGHRACKRVEKKKIGHQINF